MPTRKKNPTKKPRPVKKSKTAAKPKRDWFSPMPKNPAKCAAWGEEPCGLTNNDLSRMLAEGRKTDRKRLRALCEALGLSPARPRPDAPPFEKMLSRLVWPPAEMWEVVPKLVKAYRDAYTGHMAWFREELWPKTLEFGRKYTQRGCRIAELDAQVREMTKAGATEVTISCGKNIWAVAVDGNVVTTFPPCDSAYFLTELCEHRAEGNKSVMAARDITQKAKDNDRRDCGNVSRAYHHLQPTLAALVEASGKTKDRTYRLHPDIEVFRTKRGERTIGYRLHLPRCRIKG